MFDIFNEEEIYNSDIKEILDEYTKKCESKRIAESENRTTLQKLASIAYESTNQRHIIILIKIIFLTLGVNNNEMLLSGSRDFFLDLRNIYVHFKPEAQTQELIVLLLEICQMKLFFCKDYGGWCFFESTLSNWIYEKEILEKFPFDENGHIKTEELCEALVMQTSRMAASFRILCAYVGCMSNTYQWDLIKFQIFDILSKTLLALFCKNDHVLRKTSENFHQAIYKNKCFLEIFDFNFRNDIIMNALITIHNLKRLQKWRCYHNSDDDAIDDYFNVFLDQIVRFELYVQRKQLAITNSYECKEKEKELLVFTDFMKLRKDNVAWLLITILNNKYINLSAEERSKLFLTAIDWFENCLQESCVVNWKCFEKEVNIYFDDGESKEMKGDSIENIVKSLDQLKKDWYIKYSFVEFLNSFLVFSKHNPLTYCELKKCIQISSSIVSERAALINYFRNHHEKKNTGKIDSNRDGLENKCKSISHLEFLQQRRFFDAEILNKNALWLDILIYQYQYVEFAELFESIKPFVSFDDIDVNFINASKECIDSLLLSLDIFIRESKNDGEMLARKRKLLMVNNELEKEGYDDARAAHLQRNS